jgi:hypothetical protein
VRPEGLYKIQVNVTIGIVHVQVSPNYFTNAYGAYGETENKYKY